MKENTEIEVSVFPARDEDKHSIYITIPTTGFEIHNVQDGTQIHFELDKTRFNAPRVVRG